MFRFFDAEERRMSTANLASPTASVQRYRSGGPPESFRHEVQRKKM